MSQTTSTRREFLAASTASVFIPGLRAETRPNILWLSCEDLSPDLGCYGDTYAHTPNLDRLAREGALYRYAFSTYPVCAPSRSSIITAMWPASIGTHHMRSQGVPPAFVKCFTEHLRAAGYYCTNNVKTDYNFPAPLTAWDESSNRAHYRHRRKGQPFFAVFNNTVTHESQIRAEPDVFARQTARLKPEERHDPAKAVLPPYYPDTPLVRRDWANYYDLITALDYWIGDWLRQLEEEGLAENTVVFFWSDHGRGLPRAKRWPYDSGCRVPLIIRWPGRIEPGSVREQLVSLMDLGPTVLSIAGVEIPSRMHGRAFLGPQAAPPREYVFNARDRMDEAYDMMRAVRDRRYRYIRNYQACKPYAQYIDYMEQMPTMREMRRLNKEGKLVGPQRNFFLPEKPPDELYDTFEDPHEVNNLAGSPAHREVLERMRRVLDEFMKQSGDLGLIPEPELQERMRPGGVWQTTARPVMEPAGGRFRGPVEVRLSCPTEGASIAWTTEPGEKAHWELYARPVKLEQSARLRAKACRLGWHDSAEVEAEFHIGA